LRCLLALVLAGVAGCADPPPFAPLDAATDVMRTDAPRPDAPYVRPDAPLLPPADLEVTLPYGAPPTSVVLEVEAGLSYLDLVISMDATGSFGGEVDALQRSLEGTVVPELSARVRDVAIGIARFEDFPVVPFGGTDDRPFELVTAVTTDRARIRSALAALGTLGNGGDLAESGAEALYQLATGEGFVLDGAPIVEPFGRTAPGGGDLGGAGFRVGSYRVIVHVTDAPTHEPSDYGALVPGAHGSAAAIAALNRLDVRTLGVASNDVARAHLEEIALATGASIPATGGRCPTGVRGATRPPRGGTCPLVFDVGSDGEGLSSAITDAILGLLDTLFWDEAHGEVVDDRFGLVRAIEATEAIPPAGTPAPGREDRMGADGIADTFVSVGTGTTLRFGVVLRNETIAPADYDQFFRIAVRVMGDGVVLEEVTIRVTVPRGRLDAGARDAGEDDAGPPADAGDLDAPPDLDAADDA
jgi:hypothetical protein